MGKTTPEMQLVPVEKLNLFSASADIRERLHSRICGLPLAIAFAEGASLELSPLM